MDSTHLLGRDTAMAAPTRAPVTAPDLRGFKYFRWLGPLVTHLHAAGTARDRAGHRQLFDDQDVTLLLRYFFSPSVTSRRGLQQATTLAQVQDRFGVRPTSLGALSEAAQVFEAAGDLESFFVPFLGQGPIFVIRVAGVVLIGGNPMAQNVQVHIPPAYYGQDGEAQA